MKQLIHKVLDVLPISDNIRTQIKKCGGCQQREQNINKLQQEFNSLLSHMSDLQ